MNVLEQEIIANLRKSKHPVDIDILLAQSKITKHSRRLNASILALEEREIIFLVQNKSITKFDNKYGLQGVHKRYDG